MSARRPLSLRLLHRLCYDVLQRGPTAAERRAFTGAPADAVVPRLLRSREAMTEWFEEQLFYFLLLDRFRPGGDDIDRIPARLQKGDLDARAAIAELVLSTGFSLRNPGNDTFVTVVLEQCLGYRVQDKQHVRTLADGKKLYDGKKGRFLGEEGRSQADVVRIALRHEDFARTLLDRHHRRLLQAPLPADSPAVAEVQRDFGRFFDVLATWLQSDAYLQALDVRRGKSERQFLRGLYTDLLERPPGEDELRNLRNAMTAMADPAPLRTVLAKVILDSTQAQVPEFAAGDEAEFVTACFTRYLAREPVGGELQAFVDVLRRPAAKPVHVVRALVGSLEYQTY
ncbi:MAG: hypothetical protein AB7O97_08860 [Planctomycetota bacterium]